MEMVKRSEHVEQREFVQWFRHTYKDVRIFAIPNGGARSRSAGAKFKMEGASAGVPDLYVPAWKLWIEMKREKGGTTSSVQRDWLNYLIGIGDTAMVCRGCADAIKKVTTFKC
jgi:hypothetical protein